MDFKDFADRDNETYFLSKDESILARKQGLSPQPPHLMLFSCNHGTGHKMAAQAITESLPDYAIQVVDCYREPFKPIDPLGFFCSESTGEKIYNFMMKNEHNRLLNFIVTIAAKVTMWGPGKVTSLLSSYIAKHKPDMLISCIPVVNPMLLDAAKKFNIPFLVVTTDIDVGPFCYGLENILTTDCNFFRITIPYAQEIRTGKFGQIYPETIRQSFQYNFGYPTRRAFSEPVKKSVIEELRFVYDIRKDENVILVMMGGYTSKAAQIYAKLMMSMSNDEIDQIIGTDKKRQKIHLICLCGDISQTANQAFMHQLNLLNSSDMQQNDRVRIHGCPGTPKIAELVSLPELRTVISKPGGSTVNEMIKKKIPMVYHISNVPLDWERGNVEYGESRNFGRRFQASGKNDLEARRNLVEVLSYTFALHKELQNGNIVVPEAAIDFTANLRTAVQEMLRRELF